MEKKKANTAIGILGYGAVGKALLGLYKTSCFGYPVVKDLNQNNFDYDVEMDVLNICIPYDENFVKTVVDEIKQTKAKLTIIYSTVAPLTTKEIKKKSKSVVVHSPVRGPHDILYKSLQIFTRYIGGESLADVKKAKDHFGFLDYKRRPVGYTPAVVTELNKLISTTYFGVCIAYTDYVDKLCEIYKVPFKTFEHFNESYNRGFRRIKQRKVNRPTLYPPKGKIGGVCVIHNTKILKEILDHKLIQSILDVE